MNAPYARWPATLDARGADLVRRLGGSWHGGRGMCRCPAHADRSPSLSVRVGTRRLLFKCFGGCDIGQVIDALRALDADVIAPGRAGAGMPDRGNEQWLQRRVGELWSGSRSIARTPAQHYLERRSLSTGSPALRFNPMTPLGPVRLGTFRAALIAAVTDDAGLRALQRTFLELPAARRARDLDTPRRMLGRPGAGSVRLFAASDVLGLAEGVETALSAQQLLGIPVWATLGSERFARVAVPTTITRLILLPDNDRAGRIGAVQASKAHARAGRTIMTMWPPAGFGDWNDVLRAGGEGAADGVRSAI